MLMLRRRTHETIVLRRMTDDEFIGAFAVTEITNKQVQLGFDMPGVRILRGEVDDAEVKAGRLPPQPAPVELWGLLAVGPDAADAAEHWYGSDEHPGLVMTFTSFELARKACRNISWNGGPICRPCRWSPEGGAQ